MLPDTVSPVYPNRPIRPLPKRKLRERLPSDIADTIKLPSPPENSVFFPSSYNANGLEDEIRGGIPPSDKQKSSEIERNYVSRRNGNELESDEEVSEYPSRGRYFRSPPEIYSRSYHYNQKPDDAKYSKVEPSASSTSSADGYDSFENTNNKKKRKIPTTGDGGLTGAHLSDDLASLGISQAGDAANSGDDFLIGTGNSYATSIHSTGVSGSGRGRLGRRPGRSPLRTLSDAPNHWPHGRGSKHRNTQWQSNESNGIISSAIANAEKLPVAPSKGQENVSLLEQTINKKPSPTSTQFTFTCDSQLPGTATWPTQTALPDSNSTLNMRSPTTQATQTSPKAANMSHLQREGKSPGLHSQASTKTNKKQPPAPVKTIRRRTASKEYLLAARQRREQQEYQNYAHPQAARDIWMCQFCEYELIFGSPPEALIRKYEIKDRRKKKDEAERRRLLEKAKMKGRKNKKGNKTASKATASSNDRTSHNQSQHAPSTHQHHSHGTQVEEYDDEEYDDDYAEDEDLPPLSPDMPISATVQHDDHSAAYTRRPISRPPTPHQPYKTAAQ